MGGGQENMGNKGKVVVQIYGGAWFTDEFLGL